MSSNLLDSLNEAQRRAVTSTASVILCLAGAGSGKTTVLTKRIAYLHQEHQISMKNILALTFTRLAAKEMKERVMKLVGEKEGKRLTAGTFHSFAVQVLREYGSRIGIEPNFTIYDQEDREAIISGIIADFGGRTTLKKVMERFEKCKDVNEERVNFPEECRVQVEYGYRLRQSNAVDLDRLIDLVNLLWTQHPDVLYKYRQRYTFVFVDEFQDTNNEQMQLLELLHPENIFFVGDDFQSIYGWRGARVEFIIDLPKYRPDCDVIKLEDNYRSTHQIVQAANSAIAHNINQTKKTLRAHKSGDDIRVLECENVTNECHNVIRMVNNFLDNGLRLSDIAILARTNAQISRIKDAMDISRIPAVLVSAEDDPFKKSDIKCLLAWMDIVVNPKDAVNLRKAIKFPGESISQLQLQRAQLRAMQDDIPLIEALVNGDSEDTVFRYQYSAILANVLDRNASKASEIFQTIGESLGAFQMYETNYLTNRLLEAVNARNAIVNWEQSREELGEDSSATEFLKWLQYKDVQEKFIQEQRDAVRLITVHASKGLEFPAVIIAGLTDGVFPSRKSADIEEERRLFYVALTRAKEHLVLTYPEMTETWGGKEVPAQESRFIKEALG